ncbi:hypothetical protein E1B28_003809 [Marasmius oreades]|uniref:F-box domain-containing protein n=1 Tax=Marasmius oreades TaxID=181124 RepID=A0A9P7UXF0_9AGAR|nr:uncharacterized protein E1B28_003809 [Marasmius oreades]KAG7096365.1 hypothetical protein E1B28_003809 [Marasmius oreades]
MQQLQQYEDTIDYLIQILEKLDAERQQLETQISRRHSITSVQRRVPVEIWETIFLFACSGSSDDGYSLSMTMTPNLWSFATTVSAFPIVLSHVCRRWRAIVNSCPTLWSSISINGLRDFSTEHKILIETFLEKSAKCPLNLRAAEDWSGRTPSVMWELLKSHFLRRCGRLYLDLIGFSSLDNFEETDITFHHLLSLRLDSPIPGELNLNSPFWQAICHAPKLTQARISTLYPPNSLPYPQLTTLVLDSVLLDHMEHLLRVLELCRNLRSFAFLQAYPDDGIPNSLDHIIRPVEMPSLRTLSLYSDSRLQRMNNPTIKVLCSSLVMTTLSAFSLACTSSYSEVTHWPSSLLSMLRRSSTTLRHMRLSLCPDFKSGWEAPLSVLLETTPNLTHLDLGEWFKDTIDEKRDYDEHEPPSILYSLVSSSIAVITSMNNLVPNLEYMSLVRVQLDSDILTKILTFADSRSPSRLQSDVTSVASRSLKKIRVVPSEVEDSSEFVLEAHMLEEIRLLERDGVKIVIENSTEEASSWPLRNVEGWDNLSE